MLKFKNYIFTNKKHSPKSIMSSVLGAISVVSLIWVVVLSFGAKGQPSERYGSVCVLSLFFAFLGVILGVWGRWERDRFYFFSYLGIVLNLLAIGLVSMILYAGALL